MRSGPVIRCRLLLDRGGRDALVSRAGVGEVDVRGLDDSMRSALGHSECRATFAT